MCRCFGGAGSVTFATLHHEADADAVILGHGGVWVPGGPRGLQNRREGDELSGGFDSRPPPLEGFPQVDTAFQQLRIASILRPSGPLGTPPDAAQRNRVGSGNADLMGYIDSKLSEAGCYG